MTEHSSQYRRLYIRGVVRAMNQAQARLRSGIPAAEAGEFVEWAGSIAAQIEQICRQYGSTPDQLPAPTRKAYRFFQWIAREGVSGLPDLRTPAEKPSRSSKKKRHPEDIQPPQPPAKRLRIDNLVSIAQNIRTWMRALIDETHKQPGNKEPPPARAAELLETIRSHTGRVEGICAAAETYPAGLPDPSRRAYQWLKYLSEPEAFNAHLSALAAARQAAQARPRQGKFSLKRQEIPVVLDIYHMASLYRARRQEGILHITASEGFIHAPLPVLEALVRSTLKSTQKTDLKIVQQFTESPAFRNVVLELERIGEPTAARAQGSFVNLEEAFQRVNRQYFGGKLQKPILTWNKVTTLRKLGHYQPATDTVMLSISLDRPDIPAFVIDYVMYHELLHKHLGTKQVNGKRFVHTPAFRKAEKKFTRYSEAEEVLSQLGKLANDPDQRKS